MDAELKDAFELIETTVLDRRLKFIAQTTVTTLCHLRALSKDLGIGIIWPDLDGVRVAG
jgi:hypothetical protein